MRQALVQVQEAATPTGCIMQAIEDVPGRNLREIADQVGASRGAVRHHIHRLARDRLVAVQRQGNHRFHFAASMPATRRRAIALLRLASVRSTVEAVLRPPPTGPEILFSPLDVAMEPGLSLSCVYRTLKALKRAGLAWAGPAGARGSYIFCPHPVLRLAWVLYCKDAPQTPPLRAAPVWMMGFGLLLGKLGVGDWAAS